MIDDRAEVLPVCRVLSLTIYPDPWVLQTVSPIPLLSTLTLSKNYRTTYIFLLALVIVFLDLLLDVLGDIIVQVFGVQGLGLPANDLVQLEQDAGPASLEPVTVFPGAVSLRRERVQESRDNELPWTARRAPLYKCSSSPAHWLQTRHSSPEEPSSSSLCRSHNPELVLFNFTKDLDFCPN